MYFNLNKSQIQKLLQKEKWPKELQTVVYKIAQL